MTERIFRAHRVDLRLVCGGRVADGALLVLEGGLFGFGEAFGRLFDDVFFEAEGGAEEGGSGATELLWPL